MKTSKPVISKPVEKEDMPAKKVVQEKKEKETTSKAKPVEAVKPVEKPVVRATVRPASSRAAEAKASTKTVMQTVSYQPEFTKSVLDQPDAAVGPVYRYSDSELGEFKEIIMKKVDAAKKELVYLQGLITRKDEAGTDDTENKYMSMEDGSGSQEREQLNQMASRQIQFIDHLEKALMRIENKTYGICRVTGKLIDKARLKAVPHATLSIEAKLAKSK
ncbi:TraR/DksA C4-type zinc finger protein [uncultured Chitinophaga sp.]|uniref:TraR/DksA family transcriptional regulator n=1 Tax=uncultured Chitinophaga sp. TaxID=339340 RepID=UPI0025CD89CD|nr:TraR/DksA C4-type zinc finger protein [uncultured Chitinophaga sp.]